MTHPEQPPTEAEAIDYIGQLYLAEQNPDHLRAIIKMGPFTAFVLIGALQLAMRHPEFSEAHAELITQVITQLYPLFAGTPGAEILKLGDHPEFDVPYSCRYPFGPHAADCPPGGHLGFGRGNPR